METNIIDMPSCTEHAFLNLLEGLRTLLLAQLVCAAAMTNQAEARQQTGFVGRPSKKSANEIVANGFSPLG